MSKIHIPMNKARNICEKRNNKRNKSNMSLTTGLCSLMRNDCSRAYLFCSQQQMQSRRMLFHFEADRQRKQKKWTLLFVSDLKPVLTEWDIFLLESCPVWRTDRIWRYIMLQTSSLFSQAIDIRSFHRIVAEAAQISDSKVIHKKHKNVRLCKCHAEYLKREDYCQPSGPHPTGNSGDDSQSTSPLVAYKICHAILV